MGDLRRAGAARSRLGAGHAVAGPDLGTLADHVPDVIYRVRLWPSVATDYVGGAVTRATGYTPEEFYSNPNLAFDIIHPDDRHLLEERARVGPTNAAPIVLRWRRKDGKTVWSEHREAPVLDQAGNVIAIEGIAREIPNPTEGSDATIRLLGEFRIDLAERAVHVNGRSVRLTPAEFKLLDALTERPGRVLTRRELLRRLWRTPHVGDTHACETYVSTLRRKIERDPRFPERILTVRGRGYMFEPL